MFPDVDLQLAASCNQSDTKRISQPLECVGPQEQNLKFTFVLYAQKGYYKKELGKLSHIF